MTQLLPLILIMVFLLLVSQPKTAPDWTAHQYIPTWDMDEVGWINDKKPDRIKVRNLGEDILSVYSSDKPYGSNWTHAFNISPDAVKPLVFKNGRVKRYVRVCKRVKQAELETYQPLDNEIKFEFTGFFLRPGAREKLEENTYLFNQVQTYGTLDPNKGKAQNPLVTLRKQNLSKAYANVNVQGVPNFSDHTDIYTFDLTREDEGVTLSTNQYVKFINKSDAVLSFWFCPHSRCHKC